MKEGKFARPQKCALTNNDSDTTAMDSRIHSAF